ncbi:metallophosphoesterase [Paenibacillus thiaminolyticus]|uniref:Metallophosphoesterase n=1 Tax=Paenibacillus thiaminolyticus TaxID=49283 RepID=A0AAP9DRR7_PANTH|nr:metallophosphoesterase [Paenibacillus thiaminolyticus]MCY9538916.1 metallophosphoesterase [Paenibacillus thiaminolyticus]MCY9602610.1 metallophosphoesterase [Paenibacillus thiaminolyticus]MCY9611099.1 metallophosphoesterase [Paenibacillus thiaminolyticus]MCY9616374.1 metallophosphoesterase [Paenibacillus thiaminolyticus]MCY9621815.1 metallophosphoesterase [Paenibacillus thiaminolyticus]
MIAVIGLVVLGFCAVTGYMLREASGCNIVEEEVSLMRLPSSFDGTRLFFISDIHRRTITERELAALLQHSKADLVIVGGDMTEAGVPLERCRHNIRMLSRLGPVVAVHGNHDYNTDIRRLDDMLRELGVKLLDNEAIRLERDGAGIWLVGWDDFSTGRTNVKLSMLDVRERPGCTIVVTHDPLSLRRENMEGIDLVLSGHTHGGQICLPGFGPIRTGKFYRQYLAGWYAFAGKDGHRTRLFISRGYGTSHAPVRLCSPPEVHFITLRAR